MEIIAHWYDTKSKVCVFKMVCLVAVKSVHIRCEIERFVASMYFLDCALSVVDGCNLSFDCVRSLPFSLQSNFKIVYLTKQKYLVVLVKCETGLKTNLTVPKKQNPQTSTGGVQIIGRNSRFSVIL